MLHEIVSFALAERPHPWNTRALTPPTLGVEVMPHGAVDFTFGGSKALTVPRSGLHFLLVHVLPGSVLHSRLAQMLMHHGAVDFTLGGLKVLAVRRSGLHCLSAHVLPGSVLHSQLAQMLMPHGAVDFTFGGLKVLAVRRCELRPVYASLCGFCGNIHFSRHLYLA